MRWRCCRIDRSAPSCHADFAATATSATPTQAMTPDGLGSLPLSALPRTMISSEISAEPTREARQENAHGPPSRSRQPTVPTG